MLNTGVFLLNQVLISVIIIPMNHAHARCSCIPMNHAHARLT